MGTTRELDGLRWLAIAVVALACALRFVHLEADPHYFGWAGHVTDEGRWTEHARAFALTGEWRRDGGDHHLLLAPLFQLGSLASFEVFGVGRAAARLLPAVSGALLIVGIWALLRRRASPTGVLAGLAVVAFQADYVVLSRVAIPEMPAMLVELLLFALVIVARPRPGISVAAGVVAALLLGVKGTEVFFVAVFVVLIMALSEPQRTRREHAGDAAWFVIALGTCGLLAAGISYPVWSTKLGQFSNDLGYMVRLLSLNEPYEILAQPLTSGLAPVLNVAMLGTWPAILATAAAGRGLEPARRKEVAAGLLWVALYTALMMLLTYFPARYQVHVLTPIAFLTAVGVSEVERLGWSGLSAGLAARQGTLAWLGTGILVLPLAVVLAPGVAGTLGLPAERVTVRVVCIGVCFLASFGLGWRWRGEARAVALLVIAPVTWALLWLALWALTESNVPFWPTAEGLGTATWWVVTAIAGGLATAVVAGTGSAAATRRLVAFGSLLGMGIWIAHLAPGFLAPRFSVRDASRELGRLLVDAERVEQSRAEGLFLDNSLPIRSVRERRWDRKPPDHIVVAFSYHGDLDRLGKEYEPLRSFDLYFSPQFVERNQDRWEPHVLSPAGHTVTLYRRRFPEGG